MRFLSGHFRIGRLTVFGRNAMHWGISFWTKRYGYICFRLPFTCFGRWWPLYLYCSPNGTPWAATFMIGKREDRRDWALARARRVMFGHNFDVEKNYEKLSMLRDMI